MKRKRIDANATAAEQFDSLRNVKGLSDNTRREIISLYATSERGATRTCHRPEKKYKHAFASLRFLKLPCQQEGQELSIPFLSLSEQVAAKVETCGLYKESLRICRDKRMPQGNMQLIVYIDECTTGNVVAPDPSRKAHLIYVAWVHMPLLHRESQWLTASVLRTQDVQQLRDGLPGALCAMLASWQSEWGQGVPLDLGDGPRLHFIDKICVLADAEGLRAVTGTKGASGTKPCLRCENVLSHAFAAQSVHLEDHTSIAETDFGKCKLLTQTRLMQFLNYMDEADTVKSLEDAETLLGWNHRRTRAGFLCAESLQNLISIESCHFDSMHIYFSNGLICQEVGYWWTRLQETSNVRIEALQDYVKTGWTISTPRGGLVLSQLQNCFNGKLWKKDQDYRGNAAQCMAVLPLVCHFQEEVLRDLLPAMEKEFTSLLALANVVLKVQKCKKQVHANSVADLLLAQQQHLAKFIAAYGSRCVRPKGHWQLHIPSQIDKWGQLLDTFTPERKHRAFKSVVAPFSQQLTTFNKTCLLNLAEAELRAEGNASDLKDHLHKPKEANETLNAMLKPILNGNIQIALEATTLKGEKFYNDQFILLNQQWAAQIVCSLSAENEKFLLVELWKTVPDAVCERNPFASMWRKEAGEAKLLPFHNLQIQTAFFARRSKKDSKNRVVLLA